MKPLVKIGLLLILMFGYLFAIYGGFYVFIGYKNLKSPYTSSTFVVQGPGGEDKVKYVALGDSLTAGVGSDDVKDTFVYEFAENLAKINKEVVVVNLGISGAKTDDVINFELPQAISEKPDVITLLIGVNDIHAKSSVARFEEKYQFILNELLTKTDAKIFVLTIPYIGSKKLLLPPFSYFMDSRTKKFNGIVTLVKNDRIHIVDLYSATYDFARNDSKYYSPDLFHPSGYGYSLWGQLLNVN